MAQTKKRAKPKAAKKTKVAKRTTSKKKPVMKKEMKKERQGAGNMQKPPQAMPEREPRQPQFERTWSERPEHTPEPMPQGGERNPQPMPQGPLHNPEEDQNW